MNAPGDELKKKNWGQIFTFVHSKILDIIAAEIVEDLPPSPKLWPDKPSRPSPIDSFASRSLTLSG
jgi:hypothetical protein